MPRSLYYCQDPNPQIGRHFGVKPYNRDWTAFHSLERKINLKEDLRWHEVSDLQKIISGADMWTDFPARGLTLVVAEARSGDKNQRMDFLYLRNDGGLLPAELKIGGNAKDSVGQLLRYIADLHFQKIDSDYLLAKRKQLIDRMSNEISRSISEGKFEKFVEDHNLDERFFRLLPRHGLLIDEGFPTQLHKAVRFMNDECGFSIQLIQIEAFVDADWTPDSDDFIMRLDFTPIT